MNSPAKFDITQMVFIYINEVKLTISMVEHRLDKMSDKGGKHFEWDVRRLRLEWLKQ